MSKEFVKIDEESLYYGIYNDYEKGHTAAVSTPINQAKDPKKWRQGIVKMMEINPGYDVPKLPDKLVSKCRGTKAPTELRNFYVFRDIYVDGVKIDPGAEFAMYVKEEVGKKMRSSGGKKLKNVNLGRKMLHYPITTKYLEDGFKIDNKKVLDEIISQNGGFAFVVRGFEVDPDNKDYLNFVTAAVGPKDIPQSSVFKEGKGKGKKLLVNLPHQEVYTDLIDQLITDGIEEKEAEKKKGEPINLEKVNKRRAKNGALGEDYVFSNLKTILSGKKIEDIYHTSKEYPYSPYDIDYLNSDNGEKYYLEVKATEGSKKTFIMSAGEIKFMHSHADHYNLILVTKIRSKTPEFFIYDESGINDMEKECMNVKFDAS